MASTRVCEPKTSGVVDKGPAMARAVLRTVARAWKPLRVLFAGVLLSTGIILRTRGLNVVGNIRKPGLA